MIVWTKPLDGGSPITMYSIRILQSDGITWRTDLTNCDGSNPVIISALTCSIPVNFLKAIPFNIPWAGSIWATI